MKTYKKNKTLIERVAILFDKRNIFELSSAEMISRYVYRVLLCMMFVFLPVSYKYLGYSGVFILIFMTSIIVFTKNISKHVFETYRSGGRRLTKRDYVLIRFTTILSSITSLLLLIAFIPGLIISFLAYPVVMIHSVTHTLRGKHLSNRKTS